MTSKSTKISQDRCAGDVPSCSAVEFYGGLWARCFGECIASQLSRNQLRHLGDCSSLSYHEVAQGIVRLESRPG